MAGVTLWTVCPALRRGRDARAVVVTEQLFVLYAWGKALVRPSLLLVVALALVLAACSGPGRREPATATRPAATAPLPSPPPADPPPSVTVPVTRAAAPVSQSSPGTPGTPRTPATPRPTGRWSSAATMTTPRAGHTATSIYNGQVVVTGGNASIDGRTVEVAAVEVYDSVANRWLVATAMTQARVDHTATLLKDGTVLVVGGYGVGQELNSVERYDPVANSWTPAAPLTAPRVGHTATLLPYGRVLVVGGVTADESGRATDLATNEIYDPAADRWERGPNLATGRSNHTATVLLDGQVLIAGGETSQAGPLNSVELYDPVGNRWTSVMPMAAARGEHTASLLPDGRVLVTGGGASSARAFGTRETAGVAELYDPQTNAWIVVATPARDRTFHSATVLRDGLVLVAGGLDAGNGGAVPLATVEYYDREANRWTIYPMTLARARHTGTLLPDGTVLIAGGEERRGVYVSAAERYRPEVIPPLTPTPAPTPTPTPVPRPPTPTPLPAPAVRDTPVPPPPPTRVPNSPTPVELPPTPTPALPLPPPPRMPPTVAPVPTHPPVPRPTAPPLPPPARTPTPLH